MRKAHRTAERELDGAALDNNVAGATSMPASILRYSRAFHNARTRLSPYLFAAAVSFEPELTVALSPIPSPLESLVESLPPMQAAVVRLAARGLTNKEIANSFRPPRGDGTIRIHLAAATKKLGITRRRLIALYGRFA